MIQNLLKFKNIYFFFLGSCAFFLLPNKLSASASFTEKKSKKKTLSNVETWTNSKRHRNKLFFVVLTLWIWAKTWKAYIDFHAFILLWILLLSTNAILNKISNHIHIRNFQCRTHILCTNIIKINYNTWSFIGWKKCNFHVFNDKTIKKEDFALTYSIF